MKIFLQPVLLCILLLSMAITNAQQVKPPVRPGAPQSGNQQTSEDDPRWQKVDSLLQMGLPQSALEEIKRLMAEVSFTRSGLPDPKGQYAQYIKANLYELSARSQFEENYLLNYIKEREALLNKPWPSVHSLEWINQITYSILADLYWQYYSQNRWMILDRTVGSKGTMDLNAPVETWDVDMFIQKVSSYYSLSLKNPDEAQRISLKDYDPVLEKAEDSKKYRPTLYDFLAHRAADFFMNDEASITSPEYQYVMKDSLLLANAGKFTTVVLSGEDSLSFHLQALRILQQIEKFHLEDKDPSALVDAELKRLKFVYSNINNPRKDSLYLDALRSLVKKYSSHEVSASMMEAIANWYSEEFQPPVKVYMSTLPPPKEADYIKARQWCLRAIKSFPESHAAENCRILLNTIEEKTIDFRTQEEVIAEKEYPVLLEYRNVDKVYFRLVPTKYISNRDYESGRNSVKSFTSTKPLMEWSVSVPNPGDYKNHKTEVIMPKAPAGHYILLASDNLIFADSTVAYSFIQVSRMSYISRTAPDGSGLVYVLDRYNGKPVKGVSVQSFTTDYDYKNRTYQRRNREKYTTGEDGSFTIKAPGANQNANLSFEFRYKNDTLIAENYFQLFNRGQYRERESKTTTFFFTDRAIYRPGQTVYFKGIVVDNSGKSPLTAEGYHTTLKLYDVNGQAIYTRDYTSGDYGSFSGSFQLPSSGLTGQMRIESENGSTNFAVEEYKRPKFEVTFKPVDSTYRLNQPVEITGEARTYSDVALSDATVNYRVVRSAVFPFRDFFRIWPPISYPDAQIVSGTTKVAADGTFKITFTATPDPSDYGDYNPLYTFMVYTDVSDINGETQSGQTAVNVSNKALLLETDIPLEINSKDLKPFSVKATNLAGKVVPSTVKVELHRLKEGSLLIPRVWDLPDTAIYSLQEFKSRLPEFPYMLETEQGQDYGQDPVLAERIKEKLVWSGTLNTGKDSTMLFKDIDSEPGRYLITLSATDAFGEPVKLEKVLTIFDPDSRKIPAPEHLWFTLLTPKPNQGGKLQFLAGSAVDGSLLIEIQSKGKILRHEWYIVSGQKLYEFQLPDSLTGLVTVHANLVWNNYNFLEMHDVNIPDNSKELKFAFESFRSPLLPGGTEKWKINITGPDGKPLQAELLASMYDASLDAFVKHQWFFDLYRAWPVIYNWELQQAFNITGSWSFGPQYYGEGVYLQEYDRLNWFGHNTFNGYGYGGRYAKGGMLVEDEMILDAVAMESESPVANMQEVSEMSGDILVPLEKKIVEPQVRRNLQETAFFFPHLTTNKDGEVWVEFTVPEALTRWIFMGMAHTTGLRNAMFSKEVVTQKNLMVTPNLPRFFRDGDQMILQSKISNLTSNPIQGEARLEILDAMTMQPVDTEFGNTTVTKSFDIPVKSNASVEWNIKVPASIQAVLVRITAVAGNHSDGEEVLVPVLTNRMLVTETLPLPINGNQTKKFTFPSLINSGVGNSSGAPGNQKTGSASNTLVPHRLTLEFTSNPAWYALQALPWLESVEKENSDQIFNRFFANSIAGFVANSSQKIRSVFETWKTASPDALLSNLEKNQELKALLIEETPWLTEAKNEGEQKQRLALMFDLNRLSSEKTSALRRLQQNQSDNGGWPWFEGMPESRYITQYIVTGMGKLNHLKVIDLRNDNESMNMVNRAVNYLSQRMKEDYNRILRDSTAQTGDKGKKGRKVNQDGVKKNLMDTDHLSYEHIQFLYAMSYLNGLAEPSEDSREAIAFFSEQARKYWNKRGLYSQGMIALWAGRNGDAKTTQAIMASLREKAITNEEMGTYWRDNTSGYYWYQAPIETQAILIELFEEMGTAGSKGSKGTVGTVSEVDLMKTWLLKQKQTQSWPTTTATSEAVYALLLRGTDWLQTDAKVVIRTGGETIDLSKPTIPGVEKEAGTGYFKTSWSGSDITADKGNITVSKESEGPAWGAMYFQYFENLDKIKAADSPLKISKQLFVKETTTAGQRLVAVTSDKPLQTGDRLTVRIEIVSDRDLEYVHLKDMRASAFEPATTLSGYEWKGSLGYYRSTRDAATNFFMHYLPKGTHVFEYDLVVSQSGEYSNGISTIQCMYAPEFAAHSEGIRVFVSKNKE